jgi:hypothetical protein
MYDDTVSGGAVINVVPDKIVLTLGIKTKDSEIVIAKKQRPRRDIETSRSFGLTETAGHSRYIRRYGSIRGFY